MKTVKAVKLLGLAVFLFLILRFSQFVLAVKIGTLAKCYFNNIICLENYKNPGLAFGLPFNNIFIIIGSFLVIFLLIELLWRALQSNRFKGAILIIIILSGAFSNLLERIKYGYIWDFFQLWILPVFNLADIFIVIGAGWLLFVNKK